MPGELDGRTVVITGASSGIGRATALAAARQGANVVLGARTAETLEQVAAEASAAGAGSAITYAGDLRTEAAVAELMQRAHDEFGGIDGLVTCVGSTPLGTFTEISEDEWALSFDGKFMSTVRAVRRAIPFMRDGARVVMVAGNSASRPAPHLTTSATMNAALGALATTLAIELAPRGIGVVTLDPGPVDTARLQGLQSYLARSSGAEEAADRLRSSILTGRVVAPDEIGWFAAMLLSPRASQMTGASVRVDGGQSVRP